MTESFVNPYTFIPLPDSAPDRRRPHGHSGDPRLLSGTLSLDIEVLTPLLIRGFGEENRIPRRPDGTAFVPGSSLKGAVRSMHETLTGSCLRIFDADYLPSYRDPAQVSDTLRMAVVERPPSEGRPPTVRLCEPGDMRRHRLDQHILSDLAQHGLRSGDRLNIAGWKGKGGRPDQVDVNPEGHWVVFISAADARKQTDPYRAHVRKLGSEAPVEVPDDVWSEFLRVVEDTDDRRTSRREQTEGHTTEQVHFEFTPHRQDARQVLVGERDLATPDLRQGQAVWVDVDAFGTVTRLSLAMLWRHSGESTSGERVRGFTPCTDWEELCPSCRLFGSIDPDEAAPTERAAQRAYRGHVRFGDAVALRRVDPKGIVLPPMGAPHPGAGQAYLTNTSPELVGTSAEPALREWGSRADKPTPRELRGRKHYWHTPELNKREEARKHQRKDQPNQTDLTTPAELFPKNTKLRATLTFTDIDEQQLGSLLAALSPADMLSEPELRTHLGGGKPLGLGSCRFAVDLQRSEFHHSGARYGLPLPDRDLVTEMPVLLKDFRETLSDRHCKAVAKVLHPDSVQNHRVWYPPGERWTVKGTDKFDEGFEFWKWTSGAATSSESYPFRPFPSVEDDEQSMPIRSKPEGSQ
ncbi:TIGR03986 family CRISPR-associated RAMP protein [Saccharopolyspora sp. 7B]|uniref:TIGR03986 family type III CRISPR-associated RAMP protein n=1 Tax=Saccharopolyspora sp. 7B TaxID=2877240 RepID=UPI001CD730D1|nr:TIGR03986 family CRISPR-associated RAMP protein [Saccharopolyspora sp. 7B]MCA1278261.1 TIGR03986 family CRISPR-associated RAMP protein [Saccharopolyspora sp. 7B]